MNVYYYEIDLKTQDIKFIFTDLIKLFEKFQKKKSILLEKKNTSTLNQSILDINQTVYCCDSKDISCILI